MTISFHTRTPTQIYPKRIIFAIGDVICINNKILAKAVFQFHFNLICRLLRRWQKDFIQLLEVPDYGEELLNFFLLCFLLSLHLFFFLSNLNTDALRLAEELNYIIKQLGVCLKFND